MEGECKALWVCNEVQVTMELKKNLNYFKF